MLNIFRNIIIPSFSNHLGFGELLLFKRLRILTIKAVTGFFLCVFLFGLFGFLGVFLLFLRKKMVIISFLFFFLSFFALVINIVCFNFVL